MKLSFKLVHMGATIAFAFSETVFVRRLTVTYFGRAVIVLSFVIVDLFSDSIRMFLF